MQIRVTRISFLSKLSPVQEMEDKVAVGRPTLKGDATDRKSVFWRYYLLFPSEEAKKETTFGEVDRFLTTEEGYSAGLVLEGYAILPHDWTDSDETLVDRGVRKVLLDLLGVCGYDVEKLRRYYLR